MQDISVIVASYNKLKQLKKVLSALIPRLTKDDQLVIVDDGSSDGSQDYIENLDILSDYDFYLLKDCGYKLSSVRNKGIQLANNDCIVQIDDDYLMTGNIISKARELYDKDSLIVFRRDETHPDSGNIIRDKRLLNRISKTKVGSNLFKFIPTGNPPAIYLGWGMIMYSKERMKEIGLYDIKMDGLWGAEDCLQITKAFYYGINVLYYTGEKCIHLDHKKRENRDGEKVKNEEKMKRILRELLKKDKFNVY